MRKKVVFIAAIFYFICTYTASAQTISTKDLKSLKGNWTGTLTYLDYSSNKPYTLPADVSIRQAGKRTYIFSNIYPNEPKANSTDTFLISTDRKMMNEQLVKSIRILPDRSKEIITEYSGTDGNDNKAAIIRHTYVIGNTTFKIRKDVKFADQNEWLKRHEYIYTKASNQK